MAHSQKEDAEKIMAALEIALNQARSLGAEARHNQLEWTDNPFGWGTMLRHAWYEGYAVENEKKHAAHS